MPSLIFTPVGIPLSFHKDYDQNNHWRFNNSISREYEVFVCKYNDFLIEDYSFDYISSGSGMKWELAFNFLNEIDYNKYEFISFWDDDLITDINSVNRALFIARENNLKLFQLSLNEDSERQHLVTFQNKKCRFSITNFVEGMAPFIHSSLIPIIIKFSKFHNIKSGWGFDIILSSILKNHAAVIHEVSMHHIPKNNSHYNVDSAFAEMSNILTNIYPKFMKEYYNETVQPFNEQQQAYHIF